MTILQQNNNRPNYSQRYINQSEGAVAGNRKPDAQVWINIGYSVETENGVEQRFISLPRGLPLDTMPTHTLPKQVTDSNADYVARLEAENLMYRQFMDLAAKLEPGETRNIEGLTLQLRRVKEAEERPAPTEASNPYVRENLFGEAA